MKTGSDFETVTDATPQVVEAEQAVNGALLRDNAGVDLMDKLVAVGLALARAASTLNMPLPSCVITSSGNLLMNSRRY